MEAAPVLLFDLLSLYKCCRTAQQSEYSSEVLQDNKVTSQDGEKSGPEYETGTGRVVDVRHVNEIEKRPKFRPKMKTAGRTSGPTPPPLNVQAIRADQNVPKRKRLYTTNDNDFLY